MEVTDWAGLWLHIDGPGGPLLFDNMQDRPFRETTDWARAAIVVDVPGDATELHFGILLSGAGAVDLARPRFEEVSDDIPVTAGPFRARQLPDEPQALDFGAAPAAPLATASFRLGIPDLQRHRLSATRRTPQMTQK